MKMQILQRGSIAPSGRGEGREIKEGGEEVGKGGGVRVGCAVDNFAYYHSLPEIHHFLPLRM